MGCLFTKLFRRSSEDPIVETPKQYSWDKRAKADPKDYMIDGYKGETFYKLPGTVNGQQFIIQNCENCAIFVLDYAATVSVDDCKNCRIILGPVKTSVFVRDSSECKLLVACQQFRTRDCTQLDVALFCITKPIIESSTTIRLTCYQYSYPQLAEQFGSAGLSVFNNSWSDVHDFTPVQNEHNYSLLPADAQLEDVIAVPDDSCSVRASLDAALSVVPPTLGLRRKPFDESCFVAFFGDAHCAEQAHNFIKSMGASAEGARCALVQTKEITTQPADITRIFGSDASVLSASKGPLIGLEYNGEAVCCVCRDVLERMPTDWHKSTYISPNPNVAAQQIEVFYSVADMMLAV